SNPTTLNPASTKASASGSPTYPIPTTPTVTSRVSIFPRNSSIPLFGSFGFSFDIFTLPEIILATQFRMLGAHDLVPLRRPRSFLSGAPMRLTAPAATVPWRAAIDDVRYHFSGTFWHGRVATYQCPPAVRWRSRQGSPQC